MKTFLRFLTKPLGRSLLLGLMLAGTPALHAQDGSKPLTLKEAIQYSLQNHPSNRIYENEVKIAEMKSREALAGYLPQVNGTASFDDNLKRQVTVIPAGPFSPTDIKVQFGNQYNTNAAVQAEQVLYDQSLLYGIQANKPNVAISGLKEEQNKDNLIYTTAATYYQVLAFSEQEKLLAENERKFSELLAIQKLQYEKGVIKKVDYERVRVNLNNIQSQRKIARTNLELAMSRLKNAMGMPLTEQIVLADSVDYKKDVTLTPQGNFEVNNTWDYQILRNTIALQEIDLKRRRAQYLPTLSLYGRYGAQSFGNEIGKSLSNWFDYAAVGIRLNVPVFDGFRKQSQIAQTSLSLYNAKENLKLVENNLSLQVQNANTQLMSSYTNYQSNRENLSLARDVFENTSLQYEKGVASLSDLLNADYAFKEAQTNYVSSLLNFRSAQLELERAKGTIQQFVSNL